MKHAFNILLPLTIGILLTSCQNKERWTSLFNGKNLKGWSIQCIEKDKSKHYWSVKNGVIECDSMTDANHDYVWLQYDKEFDNFELKLKFKAFRESKGNSGVQFRSRYDNSKNAPDGGWLDGPQVDINPNNPFRNGLIYDETRTEKRWIDPSLPSWNITPEQGPEKFTFKYSDEGDGWNDMVIKCEGTRVQTWVNGIQIRDFDGSGILNNESHQMLDVGMNGFIALQLHKNNCLKIQFKDLYIRELK